MLEIVQERRKRSYHLKGGEEIEEEEKGASEVGMVTQIVHLSSMEPSPALALELRKLASVLSSLWKRARFSQLDLIYTALTLGGQPEHVTFYPATLSPTG